MNFTARPLVRPWAPPCGGASFSSDATVNGELVRYAAYTRNLRVEAITDNYYTVSNDVRQVAFWRHVPQLVSNVAYFVTASKASTKKALDHAGFRTPKGKLCSRDSPAGAFKHAQKIGLPVVVKPVKRSGSAGVSVGIETEEHFAAAWQKALSAHPTSDILVEEHIHGADHRLFVSGGQVAAILRRDSEFIDVTDDVHPEFIEIGARAIQAIPGTSFGAVDVLAEDISRSPEQQTWAIYEANSEAELRPHHFPTSGAPRDVAGALIDSIFPGR